MRPLRELITHIRKLSLPFGEGLRNLHLCWAHTFFQQGGVYAKPAMMGTCVYAKPAMTLYWGSHLRRLEQ